MAYTLIRQEPEYLHIQSASVDATGANSSDSFPTAGFDWGTFQVVHAAMDVSCVYELQVSVDDGTSWDSITESSTTTSGASGSNSFTFAVVPGALIRCTVTTPAGVAGTLTVYAILKRGQ